MYGEIFSEYTGEFEEYKPTIKEYAVVAPNESSSKTVAAAEKMCKKISEKTGQDSYVIYDYESENLESKDGLQIILIGNTSYPQSRRFLKKFRSEDFGYTKIDGKIVIGGRKDFENLKAIEAFEENVVENISLELFFDEKDSFFEYGTYSVDSLKLNGFELFEYSLVYPSGNEEIRSIALEFGKNLEEKSGYFLDIKEDSKANENEKAICFGSTLLNPVKEAGILKNQSAVIPYQNGITIFSGSVYGIDFGADSFISGLFEKGDFSVSEQMNLDFKLFDFSSASVCASRADGSLTEILNISKFLKGSSANFLKVYNVSQKTAEYILLELPDFFKLKYISVENTRVAYIYNSDIYGVSDLQSSKFAGGNINYLSVKNIRTNMETVYANVVKNELENSGSAELAADLISGFVKSNPEKTIIASNGLSVENSNLFEGGLEGIRKISNTADTEGYSGVYISDSDFYTLNKNIQGKYENLITEEFDIEIFQRIK